MYNLRLIYWRFILAWFLRISGVIVTVVMSFLIVGWITSDSSTPESLIALLSVVATSLSSVGGSFLVYNRKRREESEKSRIKLQEGKALKDIEQEKLSYVNRLKAELEADEQMFIPLPSEVRLKSKYELYDMFLDKHPNAKHIEIYDTIEDALKKHSKFVLVGDPGAGKSSTLRHVAMNVAEAYLQHSHSSLNRLPLMIRLGYSSNPPDADNLIRHWWENEAGISSILIRLLVNKDDESDYTVEKYDLASDHLSHGKLWLLFDGLNEMPDALTGTGSIEYRARSLKRFLEGYKGNAIVTCRIADYGGELDLNLPVVRILKLTHKEILAFAHKRLGSRAIEFETALREEAGRQVLANNPYALTMMIELFSDPIYKLPTNRTDLFNTYISKRYDDNQRELFGRSRVWTPLPSLQKCWSQLAYRMMIEGHGTSVDESWIRKQTIGPKWQQLGKRGVDAALSLSIMVKNEYDKKSRIAFYHQTLYEHFVLPAVNFTKGNARERMTLIRRLGNLKFEVAFPIVPALARLFLTESDFPDVQLYNAIRRALIRILEVTEVESQQFQFGYTTTKSGNIVPIDIVNLQSNPRWRLAQLCQLDTALRVYSIYLEKLGYHSNRGKDYPRIKRFRLFNPRIVLQRGPIDRRLARSFYPDLGKHVGTDLLRAISRDLERAPDLDRERQLYQDLIVKLLNVIDPTNRWDLPSIDFDMSVELREAIGEQIITIADELGNS